MQAKTADIIELDEEDWPPTIPETIYAMCPRPLHSVLEEHLLHGGLIDGTLGTFKIWAEDDADAKDFLAAIAAAKPWMEKKVVPPAAPLHSPTKDKQTPAQVRTSAKSEWNAAHAECQRQEKGLQAASRTLELAQAAHKKLLEQASESSKHIHQLKKDLEEGRTVWSCARDDAQDKRVKHDIVLAKHAEAEDEEQQMVAQAKAARG